jgi:hypothetical protein
MKSAMLLFGTLLIQMLFASHLLADMKETLPSEVIEDWKKLYAGHSNLQCVRVYSAAMGQDSKRKIRTITTKLFDNCAMQLTTEEDSQTSKLIATNSKYTFAALRNKPDSGWVLTELILEPNANLKVASQPAIESCKQAVIPHITIHDQLAWESLNTSVQVTKIERNATDLNIIKVFVKFDPSKNFIRKNNPLVSGWILLDGSNSWAIREQSFEDAPTTRAAWTYTSRNELTQAANGVVYVKASTHVTGEADPNSKMRGTSVVDAELDFNPKLSESDFSLTAFGLPEPAGHEVKQPYPKYVWWIVAGVVFLVIGVAARQISRRKS